MRVILACLVILSTGLVTPLLAEAGSDDVAIAFDPTQPNEKISIVWLSYCIGRIDYVLEHRREYPKKITGELVPTFGEELKGRFVALDTYNAVRGKDVEPDRYWDDVAKVSDAGFLSEYVWTFFHRDTWPKSDKPKGLGEFGTWRKKHLPAHVPQTYGSLVKKEG